MFTISRYCVYWNLRKFNLHTVNDKAKMYVIFRILLLKSYNRLAHYHIYILSNNVSTRNISLIILRSLVLLSLLFSSTIIFSLQNVYASTRDYNDGYAIGLSDAKKDQRCLNGHGYDPSIHRGNPDFRRGYTDGYLSYSTTHPFLGCH
jgi:hypothetical protein